MHGAKNGSRSMMRLAMVFGIVAALGMRGAVSASPGVGGEAKSPPTMSAAATQQALQTYWSMLDWGAPADQVLAENVVLTYGETGQAFRGRAAISSELNTLYHGAFAGRMSVEDRIIGGGWAATSGTFVGTHIGPYGGLAATGKSVAVPYTAVYTVVNGRIATIQLDFSQQDILSQLADPSIPPSPTQPRPGTPI